MSALNDLLTSSNQIMAAAKKENEKEGKQVEKFRARSEKQLESLEDHFRIKVLQVLSDLEALGWKPVVFWGVRTIEQQKVIFKKGDGAKRSLHVHGTAKVVQRAGWTYVQTGEAADIVDARHLWEGPAKNLDFAFWNQLGEAAEKRGLEWGGRWKNRDVAHVQCGHYEWSPTKKDFKKHKKQDSTPVRDNKTAVV